MIADLLLHPLLTKMAITAMIVIATAVAAERAGPQLGGLIASLPVSAGPAYVFLALKSDDAFIATAALSSLYANAATGLFLLHLALVSARLSAVATFASGLVLWMAASAILRALPETLPLGIVLNIAVYGGAIVIPGGCVSSPQETAPPREWRICCCARSSWRGSSVRS